MKFQIPVTYVSVPARGLSKAVHECQGARAKSSKGLAISKGTSNSIVGGGGAVRD